MKAEEVAKVADNLAVSCSSDTV